MSALGRLSDFVALNTACADFNPRVATLRELDAHRLQIGIKAAARAVIRVRDVVTEKRAFAADFASFCHSSF